MNDFSNDLELVLALDRSDWKIVKFGDVAFQQKKTVDRQSTNLTKYVKGEHMGSEDLHLREWGELTDEYLGPAFIRKFEEGDILYGSRRTYLRKVAIAHFDGITSNTTFVIKANEAKIDKRLLPFVMLSEGFSEHSIRNSKGSVNPYINWKDIADYEFLLPPKDKQLLMMELLSKGDAQINSQIEVLIKTETLKHSIVKKYFESASIRKKIKELGEIVTGGTPSVSVSDYWDGDIPFITPAEITDNPMTLMPQRFLTKAGVEKSRSIPKNSILTVCIGTIGKVAINEFDCCTNQQINALIPFEQYHSLYLLNLLKYYKNKIVSMSGATTIQIINKSSFESITLPINNEAEINSFISEIGALEELYQRLKKQIHLGQILQKNLINQIF